MEVQIKKLTQEVKETLELVSKGIDKQEEVNRLLGEFVKLDRLDIFEDEFLSLIDAKTEKLESKLKAS